MLKKFFLFLITSFLIILIFNFQNFEKIKVQAATDSFTLDCTGNCGTRDCITPPRVGCTTGADCVITSCSGSASCPSNICDEPSEHCSLSSSNCGCFGALPSCDCTTSILQGTQVSMSDGNYKNIEEVKVGDYVRSFNPKTKEFSISIVETITQKKEEEGYLIINNTLKLTKTHIIYLNGKFQNVENIKIGDLLLNNEGKEIKVFSIGEFKGRKINTYNLGVECEDNFFAGGYLVHNQGTCSGSSVCNPTGSCDYVCDAGYNNCDNDPTNGCETYGECTNVFGWAWSENIGWISFNNKNCDPNGDGDPSDGPAECIEAGRDYSTDPIPPYGVKVDETTGEFSGYTWSENIGWISFNRTDTGDPPAPPFDTTIGAIVKLDLDGTTCGQKYWVCGWARAISVCPALPCNTLDNEGGWDGWIKLRGTATDSSPYGVILNPTTSEFEGFAWGSAVVGWISFNDLNTGASVDYQVITSLSFNSPPYIETGSAIITGEEYCRNSPTGQITLQWTYQDVDGDNQAQYHLQVATDSGFSNLIVDSYNSQPVSPGGAGTSSLSVVLNPTLDTSDRDVGYNTTYYWRVQVQASTGDLSWSEWENGNPIQFTTSAHAWPIPSFTYSPDNPSPGQTVTFTDNSICYDVSNTQYSCQNDLNNQYLWDFGDGDTSNTVGDVTHFYDDLGTYTVTLSVTDDVGTCPSPSVSIEVIIPAPYWKEIPPW